MATRETGSIWPTAAASWAAWTGLLLILPFGEEGDGLGTAFGFVHLDKVIHALLFGVLAWLLRRSFRVLGNWHRGTLAALVSTAYGGLLELVQMPLPYRGAELADFGADAAGAVLAVSLAGVLTVFRRRPLGTSDC